MKTRIVAATVLFSALAALAYHVLLTWDPNPYAEQVTNYVLFWGTNTSVIVDDGKTNRVFDVTNSLGNVTTVTLSNLADGARYWFALKSQNTYGFSDFSEEASFLKPSGPFLMLQVVVEGSTNVLGPWTDRVVFPGVVYLYPTNDQELLRLKLNWSNAAPVPPTKLPGHF